MNQTIITLGAATIAIINTGDLVLRLSEVLKVPESEWRKYNLEFFDQPLSFPSQCLYVAIGDSSIIIDPGDYIRAFSDSPYLQPNYQPPPRLPEQLRELGVSPQDITHVLITHAHFDHYAGLTLEQEGHFMPTFPQARCFLGRADWEQSEMQQALGDKDSWESRTLGVLHQLGQLELVDGQREIVPAIQLIPTPGESPGHQIVRISSEGHIVPKNIAFCSEI